MAVVIVRIFGLAGFVLLQQRFACGSFAFRRFALVLAHSPVVLPGIEDEMQPGHHLFDRRQLAGWSGMALRSGTPRLARASARALWPLSSLPGNRVVRHLRTPNMILRGGFVT